MSGRGAMEAILSIETVVRLNICRCRGRDDGGVASCEGVRSRLSGCGQNFRVLSLILRNATATFRKIGACRDVGHGVRKC